MNKEIMRRTFRRLQERSLTRSSMTGSAQLPRMKKLVRLIDQSEALKSSYESKREELQYQIDSTVENLILDDGLKPRQIKFELEGLVDSFSDYL